MAQAVRQSSWFSLEISYVIAIVRTMVISISYFQHPVRLTTFHADETWVIESGRLLALIQIFSIVWNFFYCFKFFLLLSRFRDSIKRYKSSRWSFARMFDVGLILVVSSFYFIFFEIERNQMNHFFEAAHALTYSLILLIFDTAKLHSSEIIMGQTPKLCAIEWSPRRRVPLEFLDF